MSNDREIELYERLAIIEQELKALQESADKTTEKLSKIETDLNRYRGFVGGILLAITCIVTAIKFFFSYFWTAKT